MELFTIKFRTPGQFIVHKSRRFRTPVTFEPVTEKDIQFFDVQARRSMIKYDVEKYKKESLDPPIEELALQKEDEDIEVDEQEESRESSSILEKLISDEK